MRFLFSCSILGKEAAKLRKLKRYKPTKFMAEGSQYDKEAADAAVTFINCLKHTKGEWYGMPFELIDWQEQIVRDIFGILKPNGYRQFNTAYIEIPKKQGKSELAAAIALYLTCGDFEHGGEVYGCASDRQQASIVFDVAVDMVEQCPALKSRIKPMLSQKRLVYKPLGSFYQVLSAEAYTKHGLNVHGVVFDELHAQPNRDLYDVMLHGSGDARKQPLFFLITTAGTDRNSICWEVHQKAEDILQGRKIDPTFYPVIYSAADTDDWTSEKVWRKVNPSLGITVDIEKLRVACENAKQNPAEENLFRQLRLNQWVKQSVRWMPMDKWDKCAFPVDAEKLRGRTCYGGLDLSSTTDITAFVLVFPPLDESDKYQILPFFWIPEENIDQRVRRDHVPYDVWERQGFIEKVILAGDNVNIITDASRCVVCTVYMDMNSTACVYKTSSLAKPPYQFLQGFNVLAVCQYRAYQLDAIFPASRHNPAVFLFLSPDAPVAHEFPYPSIRCNNLLGIVIISAGFNPPSKKSCCSFCRLFSCHPRQFYLDSKSRCKHCAFSSLSLCFLPFGSVH
jgi:phage terminase large subunit-like protein